MKKGTMIVLGLVVGGGLLYYFLTRSKAQATTALFAVGETVRFVSNVNQTATVRDRRQSGSTWEYFLTEFPSDPLTSGSWMLEAQLLKF